MGRRRITDTHMPKYVYWKNGQWRYKVQPLEKHLFCRSWVPLGKTEKEALKAYSDMKSSMPDERLMEAVFKKYMEQVVPHKAPSTQKDNKKQMTNLQAVFGKMIPQAIKPSHIAQYRDIRGQKTVVQTNRELALLSHVFNKSLEWGVVDVNPCRGIKKLREKPRDRLPEPWEVEVVLQHANDLIVAYTPLKILTGLRQGDLLKIRLADIKDDGIRIKTGKTKKKHLIPMTPEIKECIDNILAMNREKKIQGLTLFCGKLGKPINQSSFQDQWGDAMRAALDTGDLKERFTENDLRAMHATMADEQNIDATNNLGHDDPRTTRIYLRSKKAIVITPVDFKRG